MRCNDKMEKGVRGFPASTWGGGGGEDDRFGGEGESLWCVLSGNTLFIVFLCVN